MFRCSLGAQCNSRISRSSVWSHNGGSTFETQPRIGHGSRTYTRISPFPQIDSLNKIIYDCFLLHDLYLIIQNRPNIRRYVTHAGEKSR